VALIQLQRIEEAEEALDYAKTLLETTKKKVGLATRGRLCVANAMFAYEKGEQEDSEAQFAACLESYPGSQVVISAAVNFYDQIGQKERATETLRAAFENTQEPQFARAMIRRMGNMGDQEEQERLLVTEAEERPSAGTWFALGDFYVSREKYEEACTAFEQAVEAGRNPAPMVRLAYADTLIQAERFEDAKRATAQIEDEALRALLEGRILLGQGDPSGALQAFEEGIKLWPNNPTARFLAGEAAEQIGDFDRAISEYRESVRSDAGKTNAGYRLAQLLVALGSEAAASTVLSRHTSAHPKDIDATLLLIRLSHRSGSRDAANRGLRKLNSLPGKAPLALAERVAIIAAGAGPEAAVNAGSNTQLDLTAPKNAAVVRALLKQLAALGQHDRAKELVAAALAANPDAAVFYALEAQALRASGGSNEEIRTSLEAAVERDPEYVAALVDLAAMTAADGETDAAMAMYDRAIAADPINPRPVRESAALLESSGELDKAMDRLKKRLEARPLDAWAASGLARILATQGKDLDQALKFAKRADFFANDPEASETLGWVLLLRGEAEPALKALTRAIERRPEASSARYRLGLAYAAHGDESRARELFLHVIEIGAPEAEQARAEIARLDAAAG
jgi:tetratricopeptide (TPR) repeat protein